MASEKLFQNIPPFPEDIPVASISTVPLAGLRAQEPSTVKSIFDACQQLGFFQLDLHADTLGEIVIQEIESLWSVMEQVLNLPDEVKSNYHMDPPKTMLGFKKRGFSKTETKEPDRYDGLNISRDGILGISPPQPLPDEVLTHRALLTSLLQHGQQIVSLINETLAVQLNLPSSTFTSLQDPSKPSGTIIRFLKSASSPHHEDLRTSLVQHTDFGTVTLLANVLGGLQILTPGKTPDDPAGWLYTRPRPGCLIVNLGDAMVQWTGGLLRSNCHRVTYAPGDQRFVDRYSMAMLFRPEKDASMKRLLSPSSDRVQRADVDEEAEDEDITASEWEMKMAMRMKTGDYVPHSKGGMHSFLPRQISS